MGCDLHVYVPEESDDGWCGMAYSTFNRIRNLIVEEYVVMNGQELPENDPLLGMMALNTDSYFKAILDRLYDIDEDNVEGIIALWKHSDCDGEYWTDDCFMIANAIDKILPRINKGDMDYNRLESLRDVFRCAAKKDGMVIVC